MEMISYGKQWIDEEDITAVVNCLKSDFLTQGPKIEEFENAICQFTGAKYCVVTSNGTAALHLAVTSLNLDPKSEGITTPITFVATSNALLYNQLTPVFADIRSNTYCVDPKEITKKISKKTKVIIPVHFAGQPCEMEEIYSIAKKKSIFIIEDAAHAIGSIYKNGSKVGDCKYSDMTVFSFHPVKTITTGEGGAITTNNVTIYHTLKKLITHGITKDPSFISKQPGTWYYEMQNLGYNYRLTDIQAALGLSQLKKIDAFIQKRRDIVTQYNSAFSGLNWLTIPYEKSDVESAFHLYVIKIDFNKIRKSRKEVMDELKMHSIGTQVHYIPIYQQPYYRNHFPIRPEEFPHAEDYYSKCLSLPLYPKMNQKQINHVISTVLSLNQ